MSKYILLLGVFVLTACQANTDASLSAGERNVIASRIDSLTWAFEEAERNRSPEQTVAFLAEDFYMYVDGNRMGYDSVAANIRRTIGGMQHVEPGFENVEVRVLSRDAALVSMTFRDSIVTATGELFMSSGPTTLVWERRQGEWQIVYADADHYPVTTQ